jgi:DNA-binding response OmpR family regulator
MQLGMDPTEIDLAESIARLRILIVEDDPFIQMELEATLRDNGAIIVGPCGTVSEAMSVAAGSPIDVALLDFGLANETSAPVARYLEASGIPFLFYTGQLKSDARLAEWVTHPLLPKPSRPQEITAALAKLVGRRA